MIERRTVPVAWLADGSRLEVPIITLAGCRRGPRLVCVAGIHGDEPEAIRALMELADELDPAAITGELILVPVANPPAFGAGTRTSPLDGMDLNRIFPGRPDGTASERLAHALFAQVLRSADFVFALHSWYRSGEVLPYVEYGHAMAATAQRSLAAARAAGFTLIRVSTWPPGLLTQVVNEAGIPAMEAEIGGLGRPTKEGTDRTKASVRALIVHLGMLQGAAAPWAGRVVDQFEVKAPCGGFLDIPVQLGTELEAGERLGVVRALDGTLRERIVLDRPGLLAAVRRAPSLQPGDHVARLFTDFSGSEVP